MKVHNLVDLHLSASYYGIIYCIIIFLFSLLFLIFLMLFVAEEVFTLLRPDGPDLGRCRCTYGTV